MGIPFKSWNAAVKDVIHRQQNSREVFLAYQFFFVSQISKRYYYPLTLLRATFRDTSILMK